MVDPGAPAGPPARRRRILLLAVIAAALVLVGTGFYRLGSDRSPAARPAPSRAPSASPTRPPTTAEIYQAVAPSVVSIETTLRGGGKAAGTGLVVNGNGTIVTAFHVVTGGTSLRVTFGDGTAAAAAVLASDPASDIAVLLPAGLPSVVVPAVLGSSQRLAVGDSVIAIGNPVGLTRSATTGVVSGLDRSTAGPNGVRLAGLIQFDAAVNPGSSGGPLLNARGETIGIVVALVNPTGTDAFAGIGFAVPIGTAVGAGGGNPVPQQ
jgi:putative serine protease PepD